MNAIKTIEPENRIARWIFDLEGEKVNKLNFQVMNELEGLIGQWSNRRDLDVLILESSKKNIFIAGADIDELSMINSARDAEDKSRLGQSIFDKLASLPFTTLACIDGACLGGGTELALACDFRIATDHSKTQMGLPEVNLGILPGWGGTQRLPRLIGLVAALPVMLGGKGIRSAKALKMGLLDKVCAREFLDEECLKFAESLKSKGIQSSIQKKRRKGSSIVKWVQDTSLFRKIALDKATKQVLKKTSGHYPAPLALIDVLRQSLGSSIPEGLPIEARAFGDLAYTPICKNLIALFKTSEAMKKPPTLEYSGDLVQIKRAGVIGAGVMGGGIVWLLSRKGLSARMRDLNWEALARGTETAASYYKSLMKIRRIKPRDAEVAMARIEGCTELVGFNECSVIIEAVVENMEIKKKVLAEVEAHLPEDGILCSNTSALSITEMGSALKHPERFCGFHFFNPVNRMPLVEVIPGEKTDDKTIAQMVEFAKQLGKTPVVVGNCAGFLVNRILLPYMGEAARMLMEGADIIPLDDVFKNFGMPMGPFQLADEVGIDVGTHVADILEEAYGERMKVPALLHLLLHEAKFLGKKSGSGFYQHKKGQSPEPNSKLSKWINQARSKEQTRIRAFDEDTMLDRGLLVMIREAILCLEEKVIEDPAQLDMAMIMGTGFPAFRGGLIRYAEQLGLPAVVQRMQKYQQSEGDRFQPPQLLLDYAEQGRSFFS